MVFSLFASENKKLVKKWKKEHQELLEISSKVIEKYEKNDLKATKKLVVELEKKVLKHIMIEDIELHNIEICEKRGTDQVKKSIHKFHKTFHEFKMILMDFLTKYSKKEEELDEEFIESFKALAQILIQRIEDEENGLFALLEK